MKEDSLINLLQQVKEVLDDQGIEFWLDCGTLLGAVRDGKFLPWEHDIDLGVWCHNFLPKLRMIVSKDLRNRGFKVHIYENYMNIRKEETVTDINFYLINNDKAVCHQIIDKRYKFLNFFSNVLLSPHDYEVYKEKSLKIRFTMWAIISINRIMPSFLRKHIIKILPIVYNKIKYKENLWVVPTKYFLDLSTINFYGMEFKVPAFTEEYLAYRYGEDWNIPKIEWKTSRDDGAVS